VRSVERGGLRFLTFPRLDEAGLACVLSTQPLDVRGDAGRAQLFGALSLDAERVATVRQVHHAQVAVANPAETPDADGLVTNEPGLALFLRAADCSLIVVADPEHRAVGVAHAGWKGSARGIVVNLVQKMRTTFGTWPSRCLAGVGPTIGVDRFEVGPEVPVKFLARGDWTREYVRARGKRLHFDLLGANVRFLTEAGIPRESIEVCEDCTYDSPELLHSFRREGTGSGHHGIVAMWP
jgi:YfiH family protein